MVSYCITHLTVIACVSCCNYKVFFSFIWTVGIISLGPTIKVQN